MENLEESNLTSAYINPAFLTSIHHSTDSTANGIKKYIYVNQHMVQQQHLSSRLLVNPKPKSKVLINRNSKVLINPHFATKVYVNPNFQSTTGFTDAANSKIHVNPNILRNIPVSIHPDSDIQIGTDVKCENSNVRRIPKLSGMKNNTIKAMITTRLNLESEKIKSSNPSLASVGSQKQLYRNIDDANETKGYPKPMDNIIRCKSIYSIRNIPKLSHNIPVASSLKGNAMKDRKALYTSRTKIIHTPVKHMMPRKRRLSVRSQFKIVKSVVKSKSPKKSPSSTSINVFIKTKHKLIKLKSDNKKSNCDLQNNKFKLDNRQKKSSSISPKVKKFLYINQFTTANELMRVIPTEPSKNLSVVNISGVLFEKSSHSLHRTNRCMHKIRKSSISRQSGNSKYKFVKKLTSSKPLEDIDRSNIRTSTSGGNPKLTDKLRKCNIPCPFYTKFGRCKGKDSGKCFRKHDPDQIALCTKFLQGACIHKKCLLSHNVSPEKMPTCKFYLEGVCSKDNCPYLHVRLSPKADICKDFLEGFCKLGIKCDKRHQFLCPDYEKTQTCPKQRCPYPHGRMVRKYAILDKNTFAKKSSKITLKANDAINQKPTGSKGDEKIDDTNVNVRYYNDKKIHAEEDKEAAPKVQKNDCDQIEFRSRPKLGTLPSFIAFEENQ